MINRTIRRAFFILFIIIIFISQTISIEAETDNEIKINNNNIPKFELQPVLKFSQTVVTQSPKTVEEFEKIFLYMAKNNKFVLNIPYNDTWPNSNNCFNIINKAFDSVYEKYPEYFSFFNSYNFEPNRNYFNSSSMKYLMELELSIFHKKFTNDEIINMKSSFFENIEKITEELIMNGQISSEMTNREKAKVLYEWIALNNSYDLESQRESYTGYGITANKTAVCHGYTAAYNLMCKLVGIPEVEGVLGIAGDLDSETVNHIWTRANLDGETLFIDSTWGDPTPDEPGYCDYSYFAVDAEFLSKNHKWDDN